MSTSNDLTQLIQRWQNGEQQALDELTPHVYDELRRLARHHMRGEQQGHTLQATALVNEAFVKMLGVHIDYQSRSHFFTTAARLMRRVLVDHARSKQRKKRGGKAHNLTFDEAVVMTEDNTPAIIELDIALDKLSQSDQRLAQAVELIFFGGLTYEEAAEQLCISRSTLYDDLKFAKAWLQKELS